MRLKSDQALEQSGVVANCRMNRERDLSGRNGYDRELGFNPLDVLEAMLGDQGDVAWLDLCCGSGKALIQAAEQVQAEGLTARIEILGVDLVGMFQPFDPGLTCLRLAEASLHRWSPDRSFDLITCVHGLHYLGDKLGLIARAVSWLTPEGWFAANLDLANLKRGDGQPDSAPPPAATELRARGQVAAELRARGLQYDRRRRRVLCRGRKTIAFPYRYLGGDDQAGPNYTGQPAVDSYYERC